MGGVQPLLFFSFFARQGKRFAKRAKERRIAKHFNYHCRRAALRTQSPVAVLETRGGESAKGFLWLNDGGDDGGMTAARARKRAAKNGSGELPDSG